MCNTPSSNAAFWAEIAPCEHLVQFYDQDAAFLDTLHSFVAGGLRAGDGVVVIATPEHRGAVERRLLAGGFDLATARRADRYIDLDADATLAEFMRDDGPDGAAFIDVITGVLARARDGERPVRAFGEMVALLWARGQRDAVLALEALWHDLCRREGFSLFCAYPRADFPMDAQASLRAICRAHSRVLA